jgi:hypothetical protein
MYVLCSMLIVGLICNLLVKPVNPKWHMSSEEVAALQARGAIAPTQSGSFGIGKGGFSFGALVFWAFVDPAGLGRVDHPRQRREDLLIGYAVEPRHYRHEPACH